MLSGMQLFIHPQEFGIDRGRRPWATTDVSPRSEARQSNPGLSPQSVYSEHSVHAHIVSGAPQEVVDAPLAVVRVLARQDPHRFDHQRILSRQAKLVGQVRARQAGEPTGASLTQTSFGKRIRPNRAVPTGSLFVSVISLSAQMPRSRSASRRFRRAFSIFTTRKRLTSEASRSPKCSRLA